MLKLHIEQSERYGLDLSALDTSNSYQCWTVVQVTDKNWHRAVKTFYNQAEAESWLDVVQNAYDDGNLIVLKKMLNKKPSEARA